MCEVSQTGEDSLFAARSLRRADLWQRTGENGSSLDDQLSLSRFLSLFLAEI